MKYNPDIHHRRSIRLKGYDYSQAGLYFITICTHNRLCIFGIIKNDEMILNDAGKMIGNWYRELECKFSDIKCHKMIVMPNHVHFIVENVGADLRVCPGLDDSRIAGVSRNIGEQKGEHVGSPLHRVVQWFKTMTTNEYIRGVKQNHWQRFDKKLWQRNYYEHIIRDEKSYLKISEYIKTNPSTWQGDSYYE